MSKEIFISYSRRDSEFVARLASDLDAQVAGVWFDQSTIQLGQKWHDEIMEGIHNCKAFILVLSPDSIQSRYVQEEVSKALELGKTIFPVIYRPAEWNGVFETLVKEVQTLDLRSGSYTDNFQKLVDGLVEAGAARIARERPFLRQPTKTRLSIVFSKVPGWAFAWGIGWMVFWFIVLLFLLVLAASQDGLKGEYVFSFVSLLVSGGAGGFAGGLIAGLFTMLALRPYAVSVSWKHMSPAIRIWSISGPLGMFISGLILAVMIGLGALSVQGSEADCSGLGFGDCMGRVIAASLGEAIGMVVLLLVIFILFVISAWFLTGTFAGWLAVRHIRRLEPGITKAQSRGVSLGWGCGAIVAAIVMMVLLGVISSALGV